jgi:hypothetical protein
MGIRTRGVAVAILALLTLPAATDARAGQSFRLTTAGVTLEILPAARFQELFGGNPELPRTDAEILALAREQHPPLGAARPRAAERGDECGEHRLGLLHAALLNPDVTDRTRRQVDAIIAASIPPLPKTYTSGHFTFRYTDDDPDPAHNVTRSQIIATAMWLNLHWKRYAADFTTPAHRKEGAKKMIRVNVYFSSVWLGQTSSMSHSIALSSEAVRSGCLRRSVTAHELFHRVQYSYGYHSGLARRKWMVEGSAVWSEKYTSPGIGEYLNWMNRGLGRPNVNLIRDRSYDASHLWVYLEEAAGGWSAVRDAWAAYQDNGWSAMEALEEVTKKRLGLSFDRFIQTWARANYLKDLDNALPGVSDYDEDELILTSCEVTYGPLDQVPCPWSAYNGDSRTALGQLAPHGAEYQELTLPAGGGRLRLLVHGAAAGDRAFSFIGIKENRWQSFLTRTSTRHEYVRDLAPGEWDKVGLVVAGGGRGGRYSLTIGTPCLSGTWISPYDTLDLPLVLRDGIVEVQGEWDTREAGCGIVPVTGSLSGTDLRLSLRPTVADCCQVDLVGWVSGCDTMRGTAYQVGGPPYCTTSSLFVFTKESDLPFLDDPPAPRESGW